MSSGSKHATSTVTSTAALYNAYPVLHGVGDLEALVLLARGQRDVGTEVGECAGHRIGEVAVATGDQHDLAVHAVEVGEETGAVVALAGGRCVAHACHPCGFLEAAPVATGGGRKLSR